jgi:malonyl-CoA O-methyltransferase
LVGTKHLSIENHFTKHAKDYDEHNIVQRIVSKALVRELDFQPKKVLELGCGSGQIFREFNSKFDDYVAVDFSNSMCELHPKGNMLSVHCLDFDSDSFATLLKNKQFDICISSSAMQWSKDIDTLLSRIMRVTNKFHGVLFTSNTFKSIYKITKEEKKILSLKEIQNAFSKYNATLEVFEYKVNFDSKKELFAYIKKSGVQGDSNLSYIQAKNLYKDYPHLYLEFEVVFVKIG